MTDRKSLLASVLASPADDTPRLVYADWLTENGDPDRGEFIRLQCEAERTKGKTWLRPKNLKSRAALLTRINLLLHEKVQQWSNGLFTYRVLNSTVRSENREGNFARGFLDAVTLSAEDAAEHLDAILAEHPVRLVEITEMLAWPRYREFMNGMLGDYFKVRWPAVAEWKLPFIPQPAPWSSNSSAAVPLEDLEQFRDELTRNTGRETPDASAIAAWRRRAGV